MGEGRMSNAGAFWFFFGPSVEMFLAPSVASKFEEESRDSGLSQLIQQCDAEVSTRKTDG